MANKGLAVMGLGLTALMSAVVSAQAPAQEAPGLHVVYSSGLRDAAFTWMENGRPVVEVNPAVLRSLGDDIAAFVVLHEQGHIVRGHVVKLNFVSSGNETDLRLRREMELDADCFAAFQLSITNPAALTTVLEYFRKAGDTRGSSAHPTGNERAARIVACQAPAARTDLSSR